MMTSARAEVTEEQPSNENTDKSTYKTIGSSLECENGHRFVTPEISHLCPRCDAKFNHRESNYRPIYNYELTQKAMNLVDQETDIDADIAKIQKLLENRGYSTARNDKIVGFSSSTHEFSLTGKKDSRVLLFDVSKMGGKDELTKLLGKKIDIENSTATFLDTKGNKEIVSLSQVYDINVVDLNEDEWINKVDKWVAELSAKAKKKSFARLR